MPKTIQYDLQPVTTEDCILLTVGTLVKEDKSTAPAAVFKFSIKDENKQERMVVDHVVELDSAALSDIRFFIEMVGVVPFNTLNGL